MPRALKVARAAECALLFGLMPLAYLAGWVPLPKIPLLLIFFALTLLLLLRDPAFDRRRLWGAHTMRGPWRGIFLRFALCAPALALFTAFLYSDHFLDLPRERPGVWLALLVLYPLLSVYPQEIVYRVFFYHRYSMLFGDRRLMCIVNAAAFGHMHIVYENWIAVVFTFFGGLLFARTYAERRAALPVCVEHALYGCLVFTIGLGRYFS